MDIVKIQNQIDNNRRSVAFDSYDITIRQLYDMILDSMIDIAPEYQRHFVWDEERQSQLVESFFLGIPVPSLFMATNRDSTWEVIDGLQRLTTIVNFIGDEDFITKNGHSFKKLKLEKLEKLDALNGLTFEKLPKSLQIMFLTRPVRITVLNDRSDFEVRYDLFERLNTGGITLHPQEIRNCVFIGEFNDFIKECASNVNFRRIVKMTANAERTGSYEEFVLRFFAYYENAEMFIHSVKEFLNEYMESKTKSFKNKTKLTEVFGITFKLLSDFLTEGIVRGVRKNITPVVLFEAISVGTAISIDRSATITSEKLVPLLNNEELKKYTTGATNSKKMVMQRINFVKEMLSR